jgi:hypothetical protein
MTKARALAFLFWLGVWLLLVTLFVRPDGA